MTYAEMNAKIATMLRYNDDPMLHYAAQRIEELEAEVEQAQRHYDSLRIRFDATQRVLTLALEENRVRDECLEIAMKALAGYANVSTNAPGYTALAEIEVRLAQLEPEEETG